MSKKSSNTATIIIVIVIIVIVLLFLATLGSVTPDDIKRAPKAFKDNREEAKRKHKRLTEHIEKQKALSQKLEKKFKMIYFLVRFTLLLIWVAKLILLHLIGLVNNLGDALNYSEAAILLLVAMNFLTFGSVSNLKNYLDLIKTKTENWVYGKYVNLNEKIEKNLNDLEKIQTKIS